MTRSDASEDVAETIDERLFRQLAPDLLTYLTTRGASKPHELMVAAFLSAHADLGGIEPTLTNVRRRVYAAARHHLDANAAAVADGFGDGGSGPVGVELGGLEPEHRDVLLLRYVVDLDTDDLVEVLGRPPDAIEKLELDALMALRLALPADGA